MKRTSFASLFMLMFVLLMSSVASAVPTLVSPSPNSFGEIERITLNDPADVYSGGTIVVGGVQMILPKNLLIDLPANRLSLQQIFDQAPAACKTLGESGLAKADRCNGTGSGGIATLSATRTNAGNVIVGDLFIQKAAESVVGVVTYINYDQGYYRVNGVTGDPDTGAMVRLNDPNSRHTVQSGAGCSAGSLNCSPDPRFNLDPDNYTNTFATGYPVCIPSTVSRTFTNVLGNGGLALSQANADGTGDFLCPDTNRTAALVEPPVADSRRFAPIKVGDSVVAEGNYESVGGVRFLSAHSSTVQKALSTRNAQGQPDYLFLEEVGYEAPAFQNQRLIALLIGFTTLAPTDVDVWSLHRDPTSNAPHEFPFATVRGCDAASGGPGNCSAQGLVAAGANIFKIRYDIDFLKGVDPKLSPCSHLRNPASRFATSGICSGGATTANDMAVMSPVPHEIIARTGRKIDSLTDPLIGELITLDINGNQATNGEYLFPLGLNLGGLGVAEMSEVNINELNTPVIFEGIPWNLDRRLGPSGCLNVGGCEGGAVGSATFALDPFPFSGLDPRLQATLLPNASYIDTLLSPTTLSTVRNRMFSYVDAGVGTFNGNNTVMPYALGTFPADPPFITILPTPILNMYPPVVVGDSATTNNGVPATIDVLANDVPVFGSIDPASVQIATGPASGTVFVNPTTGVITFTPADPLVSNVSFTYTVANNFGTRSLPGTVTVTINNAAVMIAPVNATTLLGASQTFTWTNIGAAQYQLFIGSAPGLSDLGTFTTTTNSVNATGLPLNGSTVYVVLATWTGAQFAFNEYTYTAGSMTAATMTTPANGSTLTGAEQLFIWSNNGATQYQLLIGSAPGLSDLGTYTTSTNGVTVTGLPTNGSAVYVALGTWTGTQFLVNNYTYTAGSMTAATMITPVNGSTLTGSVQTFTWSNNGAAEYQLFIGSAPGLSDLGSYRTTTNSVNVTGLPLNGSTVYVVLATWTGAQFAFNEYTYTAGSMTAATMTAPANGSTLTGAEQLFIWSNNGATQYQLLIGSAPGLSDLGTYTTSTNGVNVTGLPTNGSAVYVALGTWTGTQFLVNNYTYTASPTMIAATMISPANGSALTGAAQTFTWSNNGAAQYQLFIGSAPGLSDLGAYTTTTNSADVTGLPADGSPVYVVLATWTGSQFLFNSFIYTSN